MEVLCGLVLIVLFVDVVYGGRGDCDWGCFLIVLKLGLFIWGFCVIFESDIV